MTSTPRSRRQFIAGVSAASMATLAHAAIGNRAPSSPAGEAKPPDYLLPRGSIHPNTASLGATPCMVLDRGMDA